jgi:hypothetical protein
LVPVTIPGNAKVSAKAAAPQPPVRDEVKPGPQATGASLTPIRPAVVSRDTASAPTLKEKKAKKVTTTAAPAESQSPRQPTERIEPPAVRFSFPQPVIPLESALRRWFGWTPAR